MKKINKIMILVFTAFLILAGTCDKEPDTDKGGANVAPAGKDNTASASDDATTTGEDDTASALNDRAQYPIEEACQEPINRYQNCLASKVRDSGCDVWSKARHTLLSITTIITHIRYNTLVGFMSRCADDTNLRDQVACALNYEPFINLNIEAGRGVINYIRITDDMRDELRSAYKTKEKICQNELPDPS